MEARCQKRHHGRTHSDEDWEAYRKARNRKAQIIRKALRTEHRERVQEATKSTSGLWQLAKWATNREGRSRPLTPPIATPDGSFESDTHRKADLFRDTFFPPPPEADLTDTENYNYPHPLCLPPISPREIEKAILRAPAKKAPGPDGILNGVLHLAVKPLVPALHRLFNDCLCLGYCLKHFRQQSMVAIRKPGKGDYTLVKSYRLVALLNTISKALESILAKRLGYLADIFGLLPKTHFEGRAAMSAEQAIHLLLEKIYSAWQLIAVEPKV